MTNEELMESLKNREFIGSSTIQRMLRYGWIRAVKKLEELESLGYVSKTNEKYVKYRNLGYVALPCPKKIVYSPVIRFWIEKYSSKKHQCHRCLVSKIEDILEKNKNHNEILIVARNAYERLYLRSCKFENHNQVAIKTPTEFKIQNYRVIICTCCTVRSYFRRWRVDKVRAKNYVSKIYLLSEE